MVRSFVFKNDKSLLMGFVPQNVWIKPCWEYGLWDNALTQSSGGVLQKSISKIP